MRRAGAERTAVAAAMAEGADGAMEASVKADGAADLARDFSALLGAGGVLTADEADPRYWRDWSGDHEGRPLLVLRPRTTEEVAAIVTRCAAAGIPVVPQGGHTGLVAGGTPRPEGGEILLNLERMNRIRSVDPLDFSLVAEAGCILAHVHEAAAAHDLIFPLALGAQGSCQIGGNISTNAGGLNVLRYGMMRELVLGLEVVLPDGRVLGALSGLRKDNTGYDLKQLFIGAEGTLGIVTAASLKLFPRPHRIETALLGLPSAAAAVELLARARRELGDLLSAFELIMRPAIDLAREAMPDLREPFGTRTPAYVLMEASTSAALDLAGLVAGFLEAAMERGTVLDGAVAASRAQAADFWRIREAIIEGQVRRGRHLRTDVSVAISAMPAFIEEAERAIIAFHPEAEPVSYGHLGDGNIHLNVLAPRMMARADVPDFLHRCEEIIFAAIDRFGGSISAEHGIGLKKREAFLSRAAPLEVELMARLKAAFDPAGLMSPGRLLKPSQPD